MKPDNNVINLYDVTRIFVAQLESFFDAINEKTDDKKLPAARLSVFYFIHEIGTYGIPSREPSSDEWKSLKELAEDVTFIREDREAREVKRKGMKRNLTKLISEWKEKWDKSKAVEYLKDAFQSTKIVDIGTKRLEQEKADPPRPVKDVEEEMKKRPWTQELTWDEILEFNGPDYKQQLSEPEKDYNKDQNESDIESGGVAESGGESGGTEENEGASE